jgi:hypothetical protein
MAHRSHAERRSENLPAVALRVLVAHCLSVRKEGGAAEPAGWSALEPMALAWPGGAAELAGRSEPLALA